MLSNTSTNNDDSSNFDLNMCHQATKDKNWDRVMIPVIFYGSIQIISGSKKHKRFNLTFWLTSFFREREKKREIEREKEREEERER